MAAQATADEDTGENNSRPKKEKELVRKEGPQIGRGQVEKPVKEGPARHEGEAGQGQQEQSPDHPVLDTEGDEELDLPPAQRPG